LSIGASTDTYRIPLIVTCGDLADCGRVEGVVIVAVPRLDEDGRIRQAVGEHLPVDITQLDT
jgi:hypothetical protein